MASLNKLAIRGIRSFDDKSISVIEFFSPVTVIVGHNGSGKTTIIECLKYATTGDQPPNTRGGAFIHDPKMANEKEVKAQVKLRFHAANGTRMLAVRNLSVTVKKTGAMTMKTLEGILGLADVEKNGGKRGVISTKCAEMDIEIPALLGVSKAVLENVIFCHQEDSYWPLAEPAALKKKFDEIFEATKYTKALDAIRVLRKEKVAELKTEKEKLDGLSREKAHADKLKGRIAEITASIAAKTIEAEEVQQAHALKVAANAKFYEQSAKFREIYVKVDSLTTRKQHHSDELEELKVTLQELAGTDDELQTRMNQFDSHVGKQKQKKTSQEAVIQDLEDELERVRAQHRAKVSEHGQLTAEAKAHEGVLADREKLIREFATKYNMKGFDHTPLEREKVVEFINRLSELQQRQNAEADRVQTEKKQRSDEHHASYRQLHGEREGYKKEKLNISERMTKLRGDIAKAEREIENAEGLTAEYKSTEDDIEEKRRRIERIRSEFATSKYEERLLEKTNAIREMELRREALHSEMQVLNMQADVRARFDIKREELKGKEAELKTSLTVNNPKFRKLVGSDAKPDTMERELNRLYAEKEREYGELERSSKTTSNNIQAIETLLSSLRAQVKEKADEIKKIDKAIKVGMEPLAELAQTEDPVHGAIVFEGERDAAVTNLAARSGGGLLLEDFLKRGKEEKRCPLCVRDMNSRELATFEHQVKSEIALSDPEQLAGYRDEVSQWERGLKTLQDLAVQSKTREKLNNVEIPALQVQIREKEDELPEAARAAEQSAERLSSLKKELDEIVALKHQASVTSKIQQDISKLKKEIEGIERELQSTGSTKTLEDVQAQMDTLTNELSVVKREQGTITIERDRQNTALRTQENELHRLELRLSEIKGKLKDKSALETRISEWQSEITESTRTLKVLDTKITEADSALDRLKDEFKVADQELADQLSQAQRTAQELNVNVDKLGNYNRTIERYVRDKRDRKLKECAAKIEELDGDIKEFSQKLDEARKALAAIEKEINESAASMANLRDNIRARKLVKEIARIQDEIDTYDLEEAAKAKRLFEEKYQIEKDKETELQSKVSHLKGELDSRKDQLKTLESDLKEFKDINKRYRDQLIKVKLSDMANNDLEKYAKALDSAIMKYHSLKMEEVNDTMRHLWNKTYQGTDIDGIKICSDSDNGTGSRRSYNYRVVMTKDQVEMDMRGRCSAGQKMLASIIIRLALADSFGQNCGILALDEPTNALDVDNVDALASSLVDIINERKNHANFQLIIITHDENFLRKLGQSDVMEYYWRVSRDSRQKSIIERHRFG